MKLLTDYDNIVSTYFCWTTVFTYPCDGFINYTFARKRETGRHVYGCSAAGQQTLGNEGRHI